MINLMMHCFQAVCGLLSAFVLIFVSPAFAETKVFYFHNDQIGTPQLLTDKNQTVVWRIKYQPFGEDEVVEQDADGNGDAVNMPLRFPGQYYDAESGLHYNYYRDYDPSLGRYVQSDPIGLNGGLNTYAYVGGNPLTRMDPYGLCAWDLCIGETIVAAELISAGLTIAVGGAILAHQHMSNSSDESTQTKERAIPQPAKPRKGVTCTCRAASNGLQEGNCPDIEYAFGTATAPTYREARAEAERIARANLGKQAKHTQCKCTDNKGNPVF